MNTPGLLSTPALVLLVLALTGCGPSSAQLTATVRAAEILTLTAVPTATPSPSPSLTPTGTPTLTATITPSLTPTTTPTPTPNRVVPGNYYLSGWCGQRNMPKGGTLEICVPEVFVDSDYHLIFNVIWTLSYIPNNTTVIKRSDEGNKNVYLTDNLGKRYDHIAGFSGAYADINMSTGSGLWGMFDFGSAQIGAFTFTYHDEDNGILIGGITLSPQNVSTVGIVTNENFLLDQYPLLLVYQKEIWDAVKAQDGAGKLVSKDMPVCTVQAQAAHQPKGDFKSQIPVGTITYDIYGYFDETANFYVREYIYVSGLSGLGAKVKPFFYVTIPANDTEACILSASNLLSSLVSQKP